MCGADCSMCVVGGCGVVLMWLLLLLLGVMWWLNGTANDGWNA